MSSAPTIQTDLCRICQIAPVGLTHLFGRPSAPQPKSSSVILNGLLTRSRPFHLPRSLFAANLRCVQERNVASLANERKNPRTDPGTNRREVRRPRPTINARSHSRELQRRAANARSNYKALVFVLSLDDGCSSCGTRRKLVFRTAQISAIRQRAVFPASGLRPTKHPSTHRVCSKAVREKERKEDSHGRPFS